jgi:hypothetical protein
MWSSSTPLVADYRTPESYSPQGHFAPRAFNSIEAFRGRTRSSKRGISRSKTPHLRRYTFVWSSSLRWRQVASAGLRVGDAVGTNRPGRRLDV